MNVLVDLFIWSNAWELHTLIFFPSNGGVSRIPTPQTSKIERLATIVNDFFGR